MKLQGHGHLLTYWLEGIDSEEEQEKVRLYHIEIQDELGKLGIRDRINNNNTTVAVPAPPLKDKMTLAREKVLAEKQQEEERLRKEQTIHEALGEHEEEVDLQVILVDEEEDRRLHSSILNSPISAEVEMDDVPTRTIGHGREDSTASTIPEN